MINSDTAISFYQVGKKFCRNLKRSLYYGFLDVSRIVAGVRFDTATLRKDEFWALSNLSFDVQKGTSLGIVGANGSGKSTLLRLISGIYAPDHGRVGVDGKIGSLITLGAGFHPHFTGRENIFFNGTLLGLTKRELQARSDEIIEFAGLDDFIDSPVSTYSTGMRMRLGFAVAIHTSPEILLIDEILGVGDFNFIKRCYDRIEKMVAEKGITAIVVSHNIGMIQRLCKRTLVLNKGKMTFIGDTLDALSNYYQLSLEKEDKISGNSDKKLVHHPECPLNIYIEDVCLAGNGNADSYNVATPGTIKFQIKLFNTFDHEVKFPVVSILILDPGMITLFVSIQSHGPAYEGMIPAKSGSLVECTLPYLNLVPGEYRVIIKLGGAREGFFYDSVLLTQSLKVSWSVDALEKMSSIYKDCKLFVPSEWKIL